MDWLWTLKLCGLLLKKSRVQLHRGLSPNVCNLFLRVSGIIRAEVKSTKSTVMSKELFIRVRASGVQ